MSGYIQRLDALVANPSAWAVTGVAGFIGSPAMNFIKGTVRANGGVEFEGVGGTRLPLAGAPVGSDQFGNRYYRTRGGKIDPTLDMERRWVVYNGVAEASNIPPSWHGWMHHTVDTPPSEENYQARPWQKPHRPNLTGTPAAHRPSGSTLTQGRRPKATGDYKAWTPGR
jgi:NADH:ubiquinone oxidoreductase subunit